jgi:hypothetical protein
MIVRLHLNKVVHFMRKYKLHALLGVGILMAASAAIYYFYLKPRPQEETTEATPLQHPSDEEVQPGAAYEPPIKPIEVELDKSDQLVRKLVKELSSHPGFSRWFMSGNLIRRFVSIVDVVANGGSPRHDINFVRLSGDFKVGKAGGKIFLDPTSYQRYNQIADIFVSLDTEGCVKLYRRLSLPIRQAYKDLGYPEADFNITLKKAILELLNTPIVDQRIYLEKGILTYKFADPKLENLSPAQKHLLRMGPDNMRAIQAKLQEMAQALGFIK